MKSGLRFFFIFLLILILTILPLPEVLSKMRPPYTLLFFLYLQCFFPRYFNAFILLLGGFALDLLLSSLLGQHSFALILSTWLSHKKIKRFYLFSMPQQMAWIAVFCMVYQSVIFLFNFFLGYKVSFFFTLVSVLLAVLSWPWMQWLANRDFVEKQLPSQYGT